MDKSNNPWTELIDKNDVDGLMKLLEEGADPNQITDEHFMRPLHDCLFNESVDTMRLLVENGADPYICTDIGYSLLHSAAYLDYPDQVAAFLLDQEVDPNFRDAYGWTALHHAIYQNQVSYIKLLLTRGANPHIPTSKGETAFTMAEESKNNEIISLLEAAKDHFEVPDPESLTLFQMEKAAEDDQESIPIEEEDLREGEYTVQENVSGNKETENLLRQVVTDWAKEIPHHGIKKMGDAIEIQSIHYRPAYLMGLTTLYDNRQVGHLSVPYTGQSIPERQYTSMKQVNVWDFDLTLPEDFQNAYDQYVITGSQYVETCHSCKGHGQITCPSCGGKGKETCHSCKGKGQTRCYSCFGTGRTTCQGCGGSGRKSRTAYETWYDSDGHGHTTSKVYYENCGVCGGSGKKRCHQCGGTGSNRCTTCGGSGILVCSRCIGTGSITCPTCQGRGQMFHYYNLEQRVQSHMQTQCILEAHVFAQYPKFYIDPNKHKGQIKKDETADALAEDLMDSTHLYKVFRSLLDRSRQSSPFDESGGSTRPVRQRIQVVQMDVYDLSYRFEEKEYCMLVWGYKDNLQVYAQTSPFSELRDDFLKKAENRAKMRVWGKSFNWLDKADDLDVFNEEERIYELKDKVEKKMFRQYRFGLLAGSLLSGAGISWLSLGFFSKERFIHPLFKELYQKSPDTQNLHPFIMSGLFLLMLILAQNRMHRFMKKYYSNRIRHEWVRWLFPVFVAFIFSMIIWSGIWAFSASGLGFVMSRIIQGIYDIARGLFTSLQAQV